MMRIKAVDVVGGIVVGVIVVNWIGARIIVVDDSKIIINGFGGTKVSPVEEISEDWTSGVGNTWFTYVGIQVG